MIARLGGNEFAMLIYGDKSEEELVHVAGRLIKSTLTSAGKPGRRDERRR